MTSMLRCAKLLHMSLQAESGDVKRSLERALNTCTELRGIFDLDVKEKRLQELNVKSENPDVWNNPAELQKINREKSSLQKTIGEWTDLKRRVEDGLVLLRDGRRR